MKDYKFKGLGLRNIKTSIAVLVCIILLNEHAIFAAVAAVICMQDTVENSVKIGKTRLIGTFCGGIVGIMLLASSQKVNISSLIPVFTATGVLISIYLCNIIGKPTACSISSIVVISIMLAPTGTSAFLYATNRTIETAIGIIISIFINKYIDPSPFIKKIQSTNEN